MPKGGCESHVPVEQQCRTDFVFIQAVSQCPELVSPVFYLKFSQLRGSFLPYPQTKQNHRDRIRGLSGQLFSTHLSQERRSSAPGQVETSCRGAGPAVPASLVWEAGDRGGGSQPPLVCRGVLAWSCRILSLRTFIKDPSLPTRSADL